MRDSIIFYAALCILNCVKQKSPDVCLLLLIRTRGFCTARGAARYDSDNCFDYQSRIVQRSHLVRDLIPPLYPFSLRFRVPATIYEVI